jgi:opacity protein-like surface antigen
MKYVHKISLAFVFLSILSYRLKAQEIDFDRLLESEVENINPVYKPVVGLGVGYFGFIGNIKNNINNPLLGNMGYKINVSTFIDGPKHFKLNLFALITNPLQNQGLTVNQVSYNDPSKNLNFQTSLTIFGLNVHYDFDHFISKSSFVRPFISLGVENVLYNSMTDLKGVYKTPNGGEITINYNYWNDGTIRDLPQIANRPSQIIQRDYVYETPLSGDKNTIAIPLDIGLDFNITNRTTARIGYSYNYTFTDHIDGMLAGGNNDKFTFTYLSLHIDMFSDPKMLKIRKLIEVLDNADYDVLFGDEDNDGVPDIIDKCLHTPKGIPVDSVGCPFDDDHDGVPNYLDKEPNTRPGAIVDANGVEIPDDEVWKNLNQEALNRKEVETYISIMNNISAGSSRRLGKVEIPAKFKFIDTDGDGYISFDEVLKAIDDFFDFNSDLSTQDIYELNDFFFSQ